MADMKRSVRTESTTRRNFLKTSVAVTGATALSVARSAHAAGNETIRIGLIGGGACPDLPGLRLQAAL